MKTIKRALALVVTAATLCMPALAGVQNFTVKGTNPGGAGGYECTVSVTSVDGTGGAGKTFNVVWKFGSSEVAGVGMVSSDDANTLSVGYPAQGGMGVALVKMNGDGTATAEWLTPGAAKIGTEAWTPAK